MKYAGFPQFLVLFAVAVGCSRSEQKAAHTGTGGTPKPGEQTGAWTYRSADHNFSVDLPSSGWKPTPKGQFLADFSCPTGLGSAMLAGVMSAKKQSREEFQASLPEFRANIEKDRDYLVQPTFQEGQTTSGNPYIYSAMCEKGNSESKFVYVAASIVWLADKGTTVRTIFEGHGKMTSKVFKSMEYGQFESAARSICLSPR